jgi:hypothetical protein
VQIESYGVKLSDILGKRMQTQLGAGLMSKLGAFNKTQSAKLLPEINK